MELKDIPNKYIMCSVHPEVLKYIAELEYKLKKLEELLFDYQAGIDI